jgi:hypothetical protein
VRELAVAYVGTIGGPYRIRQAVPYSFPIGGR